MSDILKKHDFEKITKEEEDKIKELDEATKLAVEIFLRNKEELHPEIQEYVEQDFWYLETQGDV